jgi:hypothetical protein
MIAFFAINVSQLVALKLHCNLSRRSQRVALTLVSWQIRFVPARAKRTMREPEGQIARASLNVTTLFSSGGGQFHASTL